MMKRAIMAGLAVAALASLGAGAFIHMRDLKNEALEARRKVEQLEAAQKLAHEAESRARAARQVEYEKARERERAMQNVLEGNCGWSGIELPDDVKRLLWQNGAASPDLRAPSGAD